MTSEAHDLSHAAHDHGGHGHHHGPVSYGRAFAIGTALNLLFVIVEAGYGFGAGSMALLADAGHNLSDVFGLLVAWAASLLSRRRPSRRFTYGLRSSSILAALVNAVLLLVAIGAIAVGAIQRFRDPSPVAGTTVMIVAAIGIVVNTITALLFMSGRKGDLNIRGAYLHMAADAAVSVGVVIAGGLILWTGRSWIDPVTSLVIVAVIAWGTWGPLRESVAMSLDAVPSGLHQQEVAEFLCSRPHVADIHDLHIWSMSTTEVALTAHLLVPTGYPGDAFTTTIAAELRTRFGISHATIQIETDPGVACDLEPDHLV